MSTPSPARRMLLVCGLVLVAAQFAPMLADQLLAV
jgi:hypothetical protein